MKPQTSLIVALALSLMTSAAPAYSKGMPLINGQEAGERVNLLMSQINWFQSLGPAEKQAQAQNKPIFLVHMLGSLTGGT